METCCQLWISTNCLGRLPSVSWPALPILHLRSDSPRIERSATSGAEDFESDSVGTPNFIPAFAYDTGRLLVLAKVKTGNMSKSSVRAQMPFEGISGLVSVDDAGDLNTLLGVLKVKANGEV
jgi:hypothetical protein